ncbi:MULTISPECIES: bifunctional hydroxymethylpyrimidine kinase/phosphomethylpyrimidine kinase [unclassified Campylobacter]|uniref:bifunctional hydroxymethylpyrimidine kinase/phosphomethylpyrimidine kinase n=1 Tax=unclassified Campylobacter TaxID=2593542 RepID=UPI0022E99D6D|nr:MULTISPECIES: bifunctional hydroxymethylpyrimidine kinase/phosphomethylpyrimidine kinase [unclassified Campylobacter]MDA3062968.1 bifunctional hydroxymethylpyrimidine kinase/phosphomethylpyrimidine kinase [Campylobacter sp. JMF_14 EL1]MDA3074123.1 bifunctional hydroxymethylpyrimidine kinase/phosphomethylpyrimidine kinase [Campylobacter sp. JMF_10 EL2]
MKKILTIAGVDSSGGAGISADIKTITAHKMYGENVITALTAQNTLGVQGVLNIEPQFVEAQLESVFCDIVPDAVKIGMISTAQIAQTIAKALKKFGARNVVTDPVMVATSGGVLMQDSAMNALKFDLFGISAIITPNIKEASALSGVKIENFDDMKTAALKIAEFYGGAILVKGGDLANTGEARDILYENGEFSEFSAPKIITKNTHGTGCTLSSAIACALAAGLSVKEAVGSAKEFVRTALMQDLHIGRGNGAINHYFRIPEMF